MNKIFRWFYCLPIADALLLILLATAVFYFLRKKLSGTPHWKICVPVLFLAWTVVVFGGTLGHRTTIENSLTPILVPFASYLAVRNGGPIELYRANFMNGVLFYPLGLLGCEILFKQRNNIRKILLITVLLTLCSIGIEYIQYRYSLGQAETDDVIHNMLGAFLGGTAWIILGKFHN